MRKLWIMFIVVAALALCAWPAAMALAVEVPGVTAADFAGTEAGYFWHIIAGTGVLGTALIAVVKIGLGYLHPIIDAWVAKHRLQTVQNIVYDAVKGCYELYTKEYKAAVDSNGKLTSEQIAHIRSECREYIVAHAAHAGVDLLKEFGPRGIDRICEMMLARIKSEELKAALAPLPVSASLPLPA